MLDQSLFFTCHCYHVLDRRRKRQGENDSEGVYSRGVPILDLHNSCQHTSCPAALLLLSYRPKMCDPTRQLQSSLMNRFRECTSWMPGCSCTTLKARLISSLAIASGQHRSERGECLERRCLRRLRDNEYLHTSACTSSLRRLVNMARQRMRLYDTAVDNTTGVKGDGTFISLTFALHPLNCR